MEEFFYIFQESQRIPFDKINAIKNFIEDCKQSWPPSLLCRVPRSVELFVNWEKPPDGWLKINVDGAWNSTSGAIEAGGIIRDHNGKWQFRFVNNIGIGNSLIAEAWAALVGVQLAWNKRHTKVILESDSLEIVRLLSNKESLLLGQPLRNIIKDTKLIQGMLQQTKVQHCYRESNYCVDCLAKMASTYQPRITFLQLPPLELANIIFQDYCGYTFSRMCSASDVG